MESESFIVISIDFLFVYNSNYYLQVYLDHSTCTFINKQMTDNLDKNLIED